MIDERGGWVRAHHWFQREAVPALGLTPPQIAVYAVLRDRADEDGLSFPGQDLIARESGQSPRAVRLALTRLAEVGLVRVESRGTRQGNRYRVGMRPPLPIPASGAAIVGGQAARIEASPATDSGTSCLWIEAPGAYEVDPEKKTHEEDPPLKRVSTRDRAATTRQRAWIEDLTRMLGLDAPAPFTTASDADGLIREYWVEVERRAHNGEPFQGSIATLSPAGRAHARQHDLWFPDDDTTPREETA